MSIYQDTLLKKGKPTYSYRVVNVSLTAQEFDNLIDYHLSHYCGGLHSKYFSDAKNLFWNSDWKEGQCDNAVYNGLMFYLKRFARENNKTIDCVKIELVTSSY